MPVLPNKDSFGGAPELVSSRPIYTPDLSAPAKAMEGFGDQVVKTAGTVIQNDQLQQHKKGEYDSLRADSYFTVAHNKAINDLQDQAMTGKISYEDLPDAYSKQVADIKNNALNLVQNPLYKAKLDKELDGHIAVGFNELSGIKRKVYERDSAMDFNDNFDATSKLAQGAGTWEEAQSALDKNRQLTMGAVNNRFITPTHGAMLLKQQQTQAAQSFLARKADTDAEGALTEVSASLAPVGKDKVDVAEDGSTAANLNGSVPKDLGADYVKPYDAKRVQSIQTLVAKPSSYDDLFKSIGAKYGVDPQELKLHAAAESSMNPNADNGQSVGLMQIQKGNLKGLGITDPFNAAQSIEGAAKLMSQSGATDTRTADLNYYGGSDQKQWGKNTQQYAENLAAVRGSSGNGGTKTGNYLDYIPVPDRIQWKAKLEKTIQTNQNNAQVANVQNITDVFDKVGSGQANLSDILADKTLSSDQKEQAQALLLGGTNQAKAAQTLVGNAKLKDANVEGLNSQMIHDQLADIRNKFDDPKNADDAGTDQFLAERMQDYNGMIAKLNIARAVNMNNRGKGVSAQEYKTLMGAIKKDAGDMYDSGDRGGHSGIMRMVDGSDTPFQAITDQVNAYTKDPRERNELLGAAYTYAQTMPDPKTKQPIDLFTSRGSTDKAREAAADILTKLDQARKIQLGLPSTAPKTSAAIVDGQVHPLGGASSDVKPDGMVKLSYKVMKDAKGNQAKVYSDGRIEEIK